MSQPHHKGHLRDRRLLYYHSGYFNLAINCNLGKVNLETTLACQRLSPRQAGFCGMATGSAGAYM